MAEINPIKYSSELQKQLFPDNSFYKHAIKETGVADDVETVERPYQTEIEDAKTGNPNKLPLQANITEDGKDSYSTTLVYAPMLVVDTPSEFALNYNKRQTKQVQQASVINTKCAELTAVSWGPTKSDNIMKTTGSSRASNVIKTAGGTIGNRKAVTKADMVKLFNLLTRMNITGMAGKWYGLVTADFYSDLLQIAEFTDYDKTGQVSKLEQGILGRIMGIEIMTRSNKLSHTGLIYDNAGTAVKNALGDAVLATDRPANLFWHDKMTAVAEGKVKTSVNTNAAGYLGGTTLEAWTRFGAAHARYDEAGVVALLEDNV